MKIKSYLDIQGWFDFEDVYSFIVSTTEEDKPVYFCEVGCWLGKSTAYLAELIKKYKPNVKLYVIDTFEGDGCEFQSKVVSDNNGCILNQFKKNMEDLGLLSVCHPIKANSIDGATLLPEEKFDFIFIDADHSYNAVYKDMETYWPKIKSNGGILAGHDFTGETERAVLDFSNRNNLPLKRMNMSWLIYKA